MVKNSAHYGPDGRINGCYVYMLLCRDAPGPIYIKVGISSVPTLRLQMLKTACPITPRVFSFVEVSSRLKARRVEKKLHQAFKQWRVNGEWFALQESDKPQFNAAWQGVFAGEREHAWKMKWEKISVPALTADGKGRRAAMLRIKKRRSKAYQDFLNDSAA